MFSQNIIGKKIQLISRPKQYIPKLSGGMNKRLVLNEDFIKKDLTKGKKQDIHNEDIFKQEGNKIR